MLTEQLEIFVQCSDAVGKGHLMRSLALVEQAQRCGIETVLTAADAESWKWLRGYSDSVRVTPNSEPSRWQIRDIAGTNDAEQVQWEVAAGSRVLLMDDKGPARCHASVVVDAMMTPDRAKLLAHAEQTTYCYGLDYVPIRTEIRDYTGAAVPGRQRRLVVALGYGFPGDYVVDYCRALLQQGYTDALDVLLPQADPGLESLKKDTAGAVVLHVNREDIGNILSRADLAVTKLGMTQLEAFATGVGCLVVEPGVAHLEVQQALAGEYPGWPAQECGLAEQVTPDELAEKTLQLLADPADLAARGRRGSELVDGRGCKRIIDMLIAGAA